MPVNRKKKSFCSFDYMAKLRYPEIRWRLKHLQLPMQLYDVMQNWMFWYTVRGGGFDRGGNFSACWKFAVDGRQEGRAGPSVSRSLPFGVKQEGSVRMMGPAE